jgi:hypothetical protein
MKTKTKGSFTEIIKISPQTYCIVDHFGMEEVQSVKYKPKRKSAKRMSLATIKAV